LAGRHFIHYLDDDNDDNDAGDDNDDDDDDDDDDMDGDDESIMILKISNFSQPLMFVFFSVLQFVSYWFVLLNQKWYLATALVNWP